MQLKSVFGMIGALVPILYCGGFLYYFIDSMGSVEEARTNGLGPTLLGLAVIGLLFFIPLIVKIVRVFSGPRSPGTAGRAGATAPKRDDEGEFDADAVLARYMAKRSTDGVLGDATAPHVQEGGGPATRPSFGRKIAQPGVRTDAQRPKAQN